MPPVDLRLKEVRAMILNGLDPISLVLIIVVCIAFIILFWAIGTSNGIKRLDLKCREALSDIDVALVKRHDTLTKLIDVVKGYAKHEKETLADIVSLRNGMSMAERNAAAGNMTDMLNRINILAEQYPELKSSENYKQLQSAVVDTEEHLQAARRLYNSNVNAYNTKIVVFPSSIIANMAGAQQKSFFEAEESKRSDVKINL